VKWVDERLDAARTADASDFIYQWQSAADNNAAPGLDKIQAPVMIINSANVEPTLRKPDGWKRRSKNSRMHGYY